MIPGSPLSGAILAVFGGIMNGSFSVPLKFTTNWSWENTWLVYSVAGLLIIPVAIAFLSVPDLVAVYRASSAHVIALTIFFGFGWGLGSILFGLGISRLGMALGFAVILGLTAALGSLIPLIVLSPGTLATARGGCILTGLAIALCGIVFCARAGGLKHELLEAPADPADRAIEGRLGRSKYRIGLLICVGSGLLSSMLNLALAFGAPIAEVAVRGGATRSGAQNAIWALAVGSGSLANIGYTGWLLYRNSSWRAFGAAGTGRNWLASALMGVLWMGGVVVYGAGAAKLGSLGTVVGWPLFMATVIVASNVWGFLTGEWTSAPPAALRSNLVGVCVLIAAIVVISAGGTV